MTLVAIHFISVLAAYTKLENSVRFKKKIHFFSIFCVRVRTASDITGYQKANHTNKLLPFKKVLKLIHIVAAS